MKVCGFSLVKEWLEPGGYVEHMSSLHLRHKKPPTGPKTISFVYNYLTTRFDMSHYQDYQTEDKIKATEIKNMLVGIEDILVDNFQYLKPIKLLDWALIIFIALLMVAGVIVAFILGTKTVRIAAIVFAIILLILFEGVAFVLIVKKALRNTRKQVITYVNRISYQEIFHSRGFKWIIPPEFPAWVELVKIGPSLDEGRLGYHDHPLAFQNQRGQQNELSNEPLIKNNYSARGVENINYTQ